MISQFFWGTIEVWWFDWFPNFFWGTIEVWWLPNFWEEKIEVWWLPNFWEEQSKFDDFPIFGRNNWNLMISQLFWGTIEVWWFPNISEEQLKFDDFQKTVRRRRQLKRQTEEQVSELCHDLVGRLAEVTATSKWTHYFEVPMLEIQ